MKPKLFLLAALVIAFAACNDKDGNVPEIKDFTFKVYVLNTRAHITVTPLDNEKLYFWNYVSADELNGQTLQEYVKAYFAYVDLPTSKGEEKEDLILPRANTTYILWACYVEELEGFQLKIIGDIVSQEITTLAWGFLQQNAFSFGPNNRAFFSNCNYIKGNDYDYEQWTYYGRTSSTKDILNPQDLFTWTEMAGDFGFSVPGGRRMVALIPRARPCR